MPRPRKTVRTVFKHIGIPEDLAAKMEIHLFSTVEGKIPLGAQQEFITGLLRDYFEGRTTAEPFEPIDLTSELVG